MIVPVNLHKHYEIIEEEGIPISSLFQVPSTPVMEKFIRKYGAPIVSKMPTKTRYFLTNSIKKCRNPSGKLILNYPLDFPECQIIAEKLKDQNLRPWWNKKAVICVCHDVDNNEGAKFAPTIADMDYRYKLPTTFNFLTHDNYSLDSTLLRSLIKRGFEIGLHGYTHDQGFAFRHPKIMRKEIDQALEVLKEVDIVGYRSPALCSSELLFKILSERKFLYDSSLQIASSFYHSVKIPYPYYMGKYDFWELPLMVQDDNYLRDTNTPEKIILNSIRRFINEIIVLNGVFIINMHPHLMAKCQQFYENFIQTIKEFDDVAFATMKEVIKYAQGNINNR